MHERPQRHPLRVHLHFSVLSPTTAMKSESGEADIGEGVVPEQSSLRLVETPHPLGRSGTRSRCYSLCFKGCLYWSGGYSTHWGSLAAVVDEVFSITYIPTLSIFTLRKPTSNTSTRDRSHHGHYSIVCCESYRFPIRLHSHFFPRHFLVSLYLPLLEESRSRSGSSTIIHTATSLPIGCIHQGCSQALLFSDGEVNLRCILASPWTEIQPLGDRTTYETGLCCMLSTRDVQHVNTSGKHPSEEGALLASRIPLSTAQRLSYAICGELQDFPIEEGFLLRMVKSALKADVSKQAVPLSTW